MLRFALAICLVAAACVEGSRAEPPGRAPKPPAKSEPGTSGDPPPAASTPRPGAHAVPPRNVYTVPERTDAELSALLDRTCGEAARRGRPWLIEVTAPWCSDCRALGAMEAHSPLREELAEWPRVQVNIGDFDRHRALRKWLGVRAIAHWSVLAPSACAPALERAPILEQRILEPASGMPVSPASLAQWLEDARTAPPGP